MVDHIDELPRHLLLCHPAFILDGFVEVGEALVAQDGAAQNHHLYSLLFDFIFWFFDSFDKTVEVMKSWKEGLVIYSNVVSNWVAFDIS